MPSRGFAFNHTCGMKCPQEGILPSRLLERTKIATWGILEGSRMAVCVVSWIPGGSDKVRQSINQSQINPEHAQTMTLDLHHSPPGRISHEFIQVFRRPRPGRNTTEHHGPAPTTGQERTTACVYTTMVGLNFKKNPG